MALAAGTVARAGPKAASSVEVEAVMGSVVAVRAAMDAVEVVVQAVGGMEAETVAMMATEAEVGVEGNLAAGRAEVACMVEARAQTERHPFFFPFQPMNPGNSAV